MKTLSTTFFYKSKIETLGAAAYLKAWQFEALKRTQIFSIGMRNGVRPHNDPRTCYAKILRKIGDGGDSGRLVTFGECSAFRDFIKRFGPPLVLNSGDVLNIRISGEPSDTVDCHIESDIPLKFIDAQDGTTIDIEKRAIKIMDSVTSTNAYDAATDSDIIKMLNYREIIIGIECITFDVDIKIVADFELAGDYDIELQAADTITAAADKKVYRLTEYYPFIKIRQQAAAAGSQGVTTAWLTAKK